jgi:hypothetical protein
MRVIVQLQENAATELQQGQPQSLNAAAEKSETKALTDAAAELGVELQPLHPGQTHPLLASYFTADAPDRETAEKVVNRLSQFNIVEAAYLKPDDEPP